MRRSILVWAAVTVVALLITPPVVATYGLLENQDLLRVDGLRRESRVTYDLVVAPSGKEAYTIPDYITAEIGAVGTHEMLGQHFDDTVLLRYTARQSAAPQIDDGSLQEDKTEEILISVADGSMAASRTNDGYWTWVNDAAWRRTVLQDERFGQDRGPWLAAPTEAHYLYNAPLNTTVVLKALDHIEKDLPIRRADVTGMVKGRAVLGIAGPEASTAPASKDSPCILDAGVDTTVWSDQDGTTLRSTSTRWYDGTSGWPFRIECRGEHVNDDGDLKATVIAYLQRSSVREEGVPLTLSWSAQAAPTATHATRPLALYPPEDGTFPFTMADAHRALADDESLQRFHSFMAEKPVALETATLSYSDGPRDGTGLQYTVRDLLKTATSDRPTYATWSFHYVNKEGRSLLVSTAKWLGTSLPPENREETGDLTPDRHISAALKAGLDAELLPIERTFELADAMGHAFDHREDVQFDYRLDVMMKNDEPVADHRYSLTDGRSNDRIELHWDAETGAVDHTLKMASETGAEPPAPSTMATSDAAPAAARTASPLVTGFAVTSLGAILALGLLHAKPGLAVFYAKIARSRVLDHPRREEIFEHIRNNPGASLRDVQQTLGLGWGSAVHHFGTLERNGFITSRRSGRNRRFWVREDKPLSEIRKEALLAEPTPRRIVEALAVEPALSQAALARRLGLARSTVHHHVSKLRAAGLLPGCRDSGPEGGTEEANRQHPRHT